MWGIKKPHTAQISRGYFYTLFSIRQGNYSKMGMKLRQGHIKNMTQLAKNFSPLVIHGSNGHITVDSLYIADVFERPHKNVLQTLDTLVEDGTISRLEFKPSKYIKRGKTYRCFELTEAGFLKAMPFIGGKKSKEGQKRLVDEFLSLRKRLDKQSKERESVAFQMVRLSSKDARKLLADEIQKFIAYAQANGSRSAERYYANITRAIYNSFLIIEPNANKIRELLTAIQLSTLQTAELIVANVLTQGMENHVHYKDIYRQIKKELEIFIVGRTKVLGA
jgi:Rha family phage regulatory protein